MADDAGQSGEGAANQKGEGTISLTQSELDAKMAEVRRGVEKSISDKYADYDELKKAASELKDLKDSKKSESEKVAEEITNLKKQLESERDARTKSDAESLRLRVAQGKGLSEAQASRLRGSTKEELEADADELLESFGGTKKDESEEARPGPGGRPKEKLTPGASNDGDATPDYKKIADEIASDSFL